MSRGGLAVFDVGCGMAVVIGRIGRWVKGFRGFGPDFAALLPGEAGRVKRLVAGRVERRAWGGA